MPREDGYPRKIVLVVEDEALLMIDAVDMVEDAGFGVIEATNADEAIAILDSRDDIAAVMTDVFMPGTMDGMRLASHIRDRWPPIGILVISSQSGIDLSGMPSSGVFMSRPLVEVEVGEALRRLAA